MRSSQVRRARRSAHRHGDGVDGAVSDGGHARAHRRTRAGHVALVGLPNTGKSTLLNSLVGERLGIVGARPQTTWQRVAGIRTEPGAQMIFVDTPGILASERLIHRSMMCEARSATRDADVAIVVLDGTRTLANDELLLVTEFADGLRSPVAMAVSKADDPRFDARRSRALPGAIASERHVVSAHLGTGIDSLLDFVRTHLPEGPFLYPEDHIATAPTRFFVQELVRESVFEIYRQEIPYAVSVAVEEFRENQEPLYISAALYVDRRSQKGVVIGKGGRGIRALGSAARTRIEEFLGRRVYLDLWVRVWEGWRRNEKGLAKFGYAVPDDASKSL